MSFNFRVGAEAQPYAAAPARNTAVEEPQNETTRLTIAKSGDGDTVSISEQGKEKLAAMKSDSSETKKSSGTTDSIDEQIEKVKEQIEKIQKEIEELQKEPKKNKDQIAAKQNELMQYQGQLVELQDQKNKASGTSAKGGTRAEGMSNSLT